MLVRATVWRGRYVTEQAPGEAPRRRELHAAIALLAADAAAELGLEPCEPIDLAAERVSVWVGRHRVTGRTFKSALACLPEIVVRRAVDLRDEKSSRITIQ